jgi:hypothetical protein
VTEPLDEEIAACPGCERMQRLCGRHYHCLTHQLQVYKRVREEAERLQREQESAPFVPGQT